MLRLYNLYSKGKECYLWIFDNSGNEYDNHISQMGKKLVSEETSIRGVQRRGKIGNSTFFKA